METRESLIPVEFSVAWVHVTLACIEEDCICQFAPQTICISHEFTQNLRWAQEPAF